MLTKRQIEILLNLFSNLDAPVSLQVFTDQFHLSLRSIQTDIAEIKETIKEHGLYIENNKNCICMSITNQETANISYKIITLINFLKINLLVFPI